MPSMNVRRRNFKSFFTGREHVRNTRNPTSGENSLSGVYNYSVVTACDSVTQLDVTIFLV